ncbi:MAG TPA: hypothetical protein VJ876_07475, partial [Bacteroidales bacterium]|nr:hypothetical protein [Bacteroidales bacterium]
QARQYRYQRDSIIMAHRRMDAGENFSGKRDTLKNLLDRALQYHMKALSRQKSSNELLGLIYRNHLQELETVRFWYVGDKQLMHAQRLYSRARELQKEADSIREQVDRPATNSADKATKLDNALRREEQALRKMNRAWQIYHNVTDGVKTVLKHSLDPNPTIGQLKKIPDEALAMVANSSSPGIPGQHAGRISSGRGGAASVSRSAENTKPERKRPAQPIALENQSGLHFRVQIAASPNPISPVRLDSIYRGTKNILLLQENGWYRYLIGRCPTYHHADSLRKYINLSDAFVVAYEDGKRLEAQQHIKDPSEWPNLQVKKGLPADSGVVFRVQLAATPSRLSAAQLRSTYCGNLPVYVSWEEPFYRYLIGSFEDYNKASELQRTVCVPGAFVVAHLNGQRVDIREALSVAR